MEISNHDWKLFRKELPHWQEAYMDRLNQEYAEILAGEGSPSDKFWALEERIRKDKRHPGVLLSPRRSELLYVLATLLSDGVITFKEIENFSANLKEALRFLTQCEPV